MRPDDTQRPDDVDAAFDAELLATMRAEWAGMPAEARPPSDALRAADPRTQRAALWMRDAWESMAEVDVPPVPIAVVRAAARRRRGRALPRWIGAAAIVLAAGVAVELARTRENAPVPVEVAQPAPEPPTASAAPSPAAPSLARATSVPVIVPITTYAASSAQTFETDAFEAREDGYEIVTGKVRILLLGPSSTALGPR